MKIKIYYRNNLNLSPGKLSAQCCHAVLKLARHYNWSINNLPIIVLKVSDKKYHSLKEKLSTEIFEVCDAGLTEVPPNTNTCFAYIEL